MKSLKNGKVIWSIVDINMLHCGESVKQFLREAGIIPVVIDPEDSRRYVILIEGVEHMLDFWKKKGFADGCYSNY